MAVGAGIDTHAPSALASSLSSVSDFSGNIWFTENTDAVVLIGEYTSAGALGEYKIRNTPTAGSGVTTHLITVAPNRSIWWSEGFIHAIATLNPAVAQPGTNDSVTEHSYSPTCSNCCAHTSGISADTLGNIWFGDSNQNTFGSFPVGGGTFSISNSPTSKSYPHDGLNVDSQNQVWFDEQFGSKIAVAVQGSSPSPFPSPSTSPSPSGTPLGTDNFQRADQALWGTGSDGQTWGGDANSSFSIRNDAGVVFTDGGLTSGFGGMRFLTGSGIATITNFQASAV